MIVGASDCPFENQNVHKQVEKELHDTCEEICIFGESCPHMECFTSKKQDIFPSALLCVFIVLIVLMKLHINWLFFLLFIGESWAC